MGNNFLFDSDKEITLNDYEEYLQHLIPSLVDIFKIETKELSTCLNLRDINCILQKYNTHTDNIDITTKNLIYNLLETNNLNKKKIINSENELYHFSKLFRNKCSNLTQIITKIILYNMSKPVSLDVITNEVNLYATKQFTLNDLCNYASKLSINIVSINDILQSDDVTVQYNKLLKLIIIKMKVDNKNILQNQLIYIYITNYTKKTLTDYDKMLIKILEKYNINVNKLKDYNNFSNISPYELFKLKFLNKINKSYDNGAIFYKYIQNNNLYKQLNYYKKYNKSIIEKELHSKNNELSLLKGLFDSEKQKNIFFIKNTQNFKIVKIYGNIKDLIYDNKPQVYQDSKFDTLVYDQRLLKGILTKEEKIKKLSDAYIFSTHDEIVEKIENVEMCDKETCKSNIKNGDIAILTNMGSRVLSGTDITHKNIQYFICAVNSDLTYDLVNKTDRSILHNISNKEIDNYHTLISDLNNTKRVLYKRQNHIWLPLNRVDIENNGCLMDNFQINLLSKDWDSVIDILDSSSDDIGDFNSLKISKYFNFKTNKEESDCIPEFFLNFLNNIKQITDDIKSLSEIMDIKQEFMNIINENKNYIRDSTKNIARINKKTMVKHPGIKDIDIPDRLLSKYNEIQKISNYDRKYTALLKLITKYGRTSIESDKNKNFIYWDYPNISKRMCCIHNLDLIKIIDSDIKDEMLKTFIHKYTILSESGGQFLDDNGKYCKHCSEKLDIINDLNYINEYDLSMVDEYSFEIDISSKYNDEQRKIYNSFIDIFPNLMQQFNEKDTDFIVYKTYELVEIWELTLINNKYYNLTEILETNNDLFNKHMINAIDKNQNVFLKKKYTFEISDIQKIKHEFYEKYSELNIYNIDQFQLLYQKDPIKYNQIVFFKNMLKRFMYHFSDNNNLVQKILENKKLSIMITLVSVILYTSPNNYVINIGDERSAKIKNMGTNDLDSIIITLLNFLIEKIFSIKDIFKKYKNINDLNNTQVKNELTKLKLYLSTETETESKRRLTAYYDQNKDKKKALFETIRTVEFELYSNRFINKYLIKNNIRKIENLEELYEKHDTEIFISYFTTIYNKILEIPDIQQLIHTKTLNVTTISDNSIWSNFRPLLTINQGSSINLILDEINSEMERSGNKLKISALFHSLGRSLIDTINQIINNSVSTKNIATFTSYLSSCCEDNIESSYLTYFKNNGVNIDLLLSLIKKNNKTVNFIDYSPSYESNTPINENYTLLDYMNHGDDTINYKSEFKMLNMKIITELFTTNSMLGDKRYFKKIFDRDIFLLQDFYTKDININNVELRGQLKTKIKDNYFNDHPTVPITDEFLDNKINLLFPPFNGTYEIDVVSGNYKHVITDKINQSLESLSYNEIKLFVNKYHELNKTILVNTDVLYKEKTGGIMKIDIFNKEKLQINTILENVTELFINNEDSILQDNTIITNEIIDLFTNIVTSDYKLIGDNRIELIQKFRGLINNLEITKFMSLNRKFNVLKNITEYQFTEEELSISKIENILKIENFVKNKNIEESYRKDSISKHFMSKKINLLKKFINFIFINIVSIYNKVKNNNTFKTLNMNSVTGPDGDYYKYNYIDDSYKEDDPTVSKLIKKPTYWGFKHKENIIKTCKCSQYSELTIYDEDKPELYGIFITNLIVIDNFIETKINDSSKPAYKEQFEEILKSFININMKGYKSILKNLNNSSHEDSLFSDIFVSSILNFIVVYLLKFISEEFDETIFNYFVDLFHKELLFINNKTDNNKDIFDDMITIKKNASLLRKKQYDDLDDEDKNTKEIFRSLNLGSILQSKLNIQEDEENQLVTENIQDGNNDSYNDGNIIEGADQINMDDYNQNFDNDDDV